MKIQGYNGFEQGAGKKSFDQRATIQGSAKKKAEDDDELEDEITEELDEVEEDDDLEDSPDAGYQDNLKGLDDDFDDDDEDY